MDLPKLSTSVRKRSGKGPARRLRQKGLIPAVLYGQGVDTTPLALDPSALTKALAGPRRTNTILELEIAGAKEGHTAMVRDHQFDPVTRRLLHVDLLAVKMDQKLSVEVPLSLTGRSVGEQLGGTLSKLFRKLPVECLPNDIPSEIMMDVTSLNIGGTLTARDLVLPENVSLLIDEKTPIVTIVAKRVEDEARKGDEGEGQASAEASAEAPAENKSE